MIRRSTAEMETPEELAARALLERDLGRPLHRVTLGTTLLSSAELRLPPGIDGLGWIRGEVASRLVPAGGSRATGAPEFQDPDR